MLKNFKNAIRLLNERQKVLNDFESGIFPKGKQGKGLTSTLDEQLKILTPKQMLQILPITLAQIKADNTSETLLN